MKMIYIFIALVILGQSSLYAQDELSNEIEKLESGDFEESQVNQDPVESAQDIESEILDSGIEEDAFQEAAPAPETVPAPDTLPEDIEALAPQEESVIETQPAFEEINPEQNLEDSLEPVEDTDFATEPPPAPEENVESAPIEEPVFEESIAQVPNDFENRLNRIYEQFYKEPTTDDVWSQIIGDKINESYTIQPGDTLWDVSQTFFGNGHYWPKVWQVNDTITNPHNIEPGFAIQFVQGKLNEAPQINIVQNETNTTGENVANLEDPNAARPQAEPVIPPPSKRYVPVLQKLPPSLPFIKGPNIGGYDKRGFAVDKKIVPVAPAAVYVSSYLSEEPPTQIGKIIDQEGESRENAALYDMIYVQTEDVELRPGEKLLVYSVGDKILSLDKDSYLGKQIHLLGEVKIQSVINQEENVYKAMVIKSISQLKTGSYISRDKLITTTTEENGASASVSANVVGGEFEATRYHLGMHEVIYLDKGREAGVREGQIFSVIRNPQVRNKKNIIEDLSVQIAKVKIVKTTNSFSTGVILNPIDDVRKGDIVSPLRKVAKGFSEDSASEFNGEATLDESDDEFESGLDETTDEFIEEE